MRLYSLSYLAMLGSQYSGCHAANVLGAVRLARYFWYLICACSGARAGHQSGGNRLRL